MSSRWAYGKKADGSWVKITYTIYNILYNITKFIVDKLKIMWTGSLRKVPATKKNHISETILDD